MLVRICLATWKRRSPYFKEKLNTNHSHLGHLISHPTSIGYDLAGLDDQHLSQVRLQMVLCDSCEYQLEPLQERIRDARHSNGTKGACYGWVNIVLKLSLFSEHSQYWVIIDTLMTSSR